jgi:exosortase
VTMGNSNAGQIPLGEVAGLVEFDVSRQTPPEESALLGPTSKIRQQCRSSSNSRMETLFAAALLASLTVIMYAPVLRSMARQWWDDPNYGHAMFVPVFVAYVLWRERARWRAVPVRPSDYGLPIMALALGLLILGMLAVELFTSRFSLLLLIAGIVVFLAGWQVLKSIAFPVGYLFFMIPLPALVYYQLTFPLQLLASRLGAQGLVMLGVHTVRQGNLLILPNCTLEVVEACSGVRSLLSLLAVVVAYGYLAERRAWLRCLLVVLTIPIVIGSNGLRLVATGVLSFLYGPQMDSGRAHVALGLGFFAIAFLSILLIHVLVRHFANQRIPDPAHS